MKINKYFFLIMNLGYYCAYANTQTSLCATHEIVDIGKELSCIAPARSAGATNFYIQFNSLEKNNKYECKFDSSIVYASLLVDQSKFPTGTEVIYSNQEYKFPLTVNIDSFKMIDIESAFEVKYMVGASDYSTTITAQCIKQ